MSSPLDFEILMKKIDSLSNEIKDLKNSVDKQPKWITLSTLCFDTGKSRQTLLSHLESNYEPEVDYDKFDNVIMVRSQIVPSIKDYYERKNKK